MSSPKVLIIGAGIVGLSLAQSLLHNGIDFKIYDRDQSSDSRDQGYAVTIHNVLDQLRAIVPCDANVGIFHGTEHGGFYSNGYTREQEGFWDSTPQTTWIRANRQKFRDWLITGIKVNWNMMFLGYEVNVEVVTATFEDGHKTTGNIIVGADGILSRVREQIFSPNLSTSTTLPIAIIAGQSKLSPEQYKRQFDLASAIHISRGDDFRLFVGCKTIAPDLSFTEHYWFLIYNDEAASKPGF